MHRIRHRLAQPGLVAIAASALIASGLAACGGSSSTSTTATQANATVSSAASGPTGTTPSGQKGTPARTGKAAPRRLSGIRECLQHNGVKLPSGAGARGLFLGGGLKGVTRSQLRTAMRKCLGGGPAPTRAARGGVLRGNSRFRLALADFASCMRKNGVNVPAPNTSGKGPIFSTKGLNTASAQFKAAAAKCRLALSAAFRRPPGAPTGAGAAAQPTG